CGQGTYVPFSF
nr:immunoglobulin light chain junction region [Macaca mulatta]MOW10673.1 immunoglobulin light chain junction region [Macaca mulatta]MOW11075.1 immunoglobulin light chain junction region [Macaca mulatta]MOW11151.1 immunoglobulin light chain junction region [Macaca mulatta]MOW11188.1 immunoglobulin light chain junction region [Macaca mulatta]